MSEVVELEIPARPEFVALTRLVVTAAASIEPTFTDDRIDDLRIAVSEACTNAVEAHTGVGARDRVVVRCDLGDDRIEVAVTDRGGGFDPDDVAAAPAPDADDRLEFEGGLGIPLMRVLVDETEFRASPTGTVVRLVVLRSSGGRPARRV